MAESLPTRRSSLIRIAFKPLEWVLLGLLWIYRIGFSPLLPPSCRFTPSCSVYAMESIRIHGPILGGWKSMGRLLRCHPFHPGGHDPP